MDEHTIDHMKLDIGQVNYILRRYKKYKKSIVSNIKSLNKISKLHSVFLTKVSSNSVHMYNTHMIRLNNLTTAMGPIIDHLKKIKKDLMSILKRFKKNYDSRLEQEFKDMYAKTCIVIARFEAIHHI